MLKTSQVLKTMLLTPEFVDKLIFAMASGEVEWESNPKWSNMESTQPALMAFMGRARHGNSHELVHKLVLHRTHTRVLYEESSAHMASRKAAVPDMDGDSRSQARSSSHQHTDKSSPKHMASEASVPNLAIVPRAFTS